MVVHRIPGKQIRHQVLKHGVLPRVHARRAYSCEYQTQLCTMNRNYLRMAISQRRLPACGENIVLTGKSSADLPL